MVVGWAPRWTGQTERTSLLTLGGALPLAGGGCAATAGLSRKGQESQGGDGDAQAAQAVRSRTRSASGLPQGRRWGRRAWLCGRRKGSVP
jgi:hypothetical protein